MDMKLEGIEVRYIEKPKRAFLDSNVLAQVIAGSKRGEKIAKLLRDAKFELVTCSKCVYELYSLAKGTTKAQDPDRNHPLKKLIPPDINNIAQKLFKKMPDIDALGNAYYWYNQCEEWQGWDHFETMGSLIETLVIESDRQKAKELLEKQKQFVIWKEAMLSVFSEIDSLIKKEGIQVCHYFQVFSSDWYKKYGFFYEQDFAKDSLIPNEDFEIVLSALFLEAKVFVTEDDKGLIWRGGLSLGLNSPNLTFCCPERLEEAIESNFIFRFFRKK
jgi:hypothetical protein